ncbi:MAG: hypothetical protein K8R45_03765 [Desulfobacterales bacterium]|nr:hypothetical protein [Desulfobacterales bacterium]
MTILSDVSIEISPEEVLQSLSRGRGLPDHFLPVVEEAIYIAREIWQPKAVYKWIPTRGVEAETLYLKPGDGNETVSLHLGPNAELASPAREILIGVNTIGGGLEERGRELNEAGEALLGYFLDSVGVIALGKTRDALSRTAEKEAARRGWRVGAALGPGSLKGWSITGQKDLVSMVPLSEIDVRISDSGVLIPFKSASVLIGIGPGYEKQKVGSVCHLCHNRDTCWRRRS